MPLSITEPCSLTDGGSCATSSNYPGDYGSDEECTIKGVPPAGLEVVAFDVEDYCSYDYITVNGVKYCGTSGPQGVVPEDGVIEWKSDEIEVRSGWKARPGPSHIPCFTSLIPLLPLPLRSAGHTGRLHRHQRRPPRHHRRSPPAFSPRRARTSSAP